jgi:hypothetical protein
MEVAFSLNKNGSANELRLDHFDMKHANKQGLFGISSALKHLHTRVVNFLNLTYKPICCPAIYNLLLSDFGSKSNKDTRSSKKT